MEFSMQPLFGVLEYLRCKAQGMRTTGVYWRKRFSPNADGNAADRILWHIVIQNDTPAF